MTQPTISVAMATYNGEKYLPAQLASIASQTHLPIELQIGDDGSADNSLAVVEDFARTAPFPVTIRSNKPALGCGSNFMSAARRCSGDWIAFVDQDDVWTDNKLQRVVEIIAESPSDTLLVVHNARLTDEDLTPRGKLINGPFGTFPRFTLPPLYLAHGFREVFKRDPIVALPEQGRSIGWIAASDAHDNWVSVIASLLGSVVSVDEELAFYRRHAAALTNIPPVALSTKAKQIASNNAGIYQCEAAAYANLADYLTANADCAPGFEGRMREASQQVRVLSTILDRRSTVHGGGNRLTRLRSLLALIRDRSYSRSNGWRLGMKSVAKDMVGAVV